MADFTASVFHESENTEPNEAIEFAKSLAKNIWNLGLAVYLYIKGTKKYEKKLKHLCSYL